jgi:hypothetical protein
MLTRTQIVAMSDQQLVTAILDIAAVIASPCKDFSPTKRTAHQRNVQDAKAVVEIIRAEIKLRQYKAAIGNAPLITERKPSWCWGDARPQINRTSKKGGGVWMPHRS